MQQVDVTQAVTTRARIGRMKFRECGEILKRKRFSFKIKGKVCKSCIRSAILCDTEVMLNIAIKQKKQNERLFDQCVM